MEVIQGIICVTGTFTLDDRTPHSRSRTQSDHLGDGLKRRLARVCLSSEHVRRHVLNPPGLRRLRFPSFLSLVKEQQRDQKTSRPRAPIKHPGVATETRSGYSPESFLPVREIAVYRRPASRCISAAAPTRGFLCPQLSQVNTNLNFSVTNRELRT